VSKQYPDIWFPLGRREVHVKLQNGQPIDIVMDPYERGCLVVEECRNPDLRDKLIEAGGVEAISRKWYVNPGYGEVGIKQADGTTHRHGPPSFECTSPNCSEFLLAEYHRTYPPRGFGGSHGISPGTDCPPYAVLGPGQVSTISAAEYADKLDRERRMTQERRMMEYQSERDEAIASAAAKGVAEALGQSAPKAKR
jgi:hypothetical protein